MYILKQENHMLDLDLVKHGNNLQTGEDVAAKWKDLVDTFRSKEKSGAEGGTVAEKAQNWAFYDRMSFMKPYMYKRR